nr:hypothetical protein [Tanacetum cinerariifolium]
MQAYYAKESPIPSPVIMPPSLMLSPMFNPQEFFLSEELLPPKKCGRDRSSSSTPTLPQEFEIGESSSKTSLERHKEQIEEILNHLDKLYLDLIENMEDNIKGLRIGSEKMMEAFIGGLPQSIKWKGTTSKPQTLEESINIAQRLMDQETVRSYAATPAENNGYTGIRPLFKNQAISTQDWKSAAKAGSTGHFLKESSNEVLKAKDSKFRDQSCQLFKVQIKEKAKSKVQGPNMEISQSIATRAISAKV